MSRLVKDNKEDTKKEFNSNKKLLKPRLRKKKLELLAKYINLKDNKDKNKAKEKEEKSLKVIIEIYYNLKSNSKEEINTRPIIAKISNLFTYFKSIILTSSLPLPTTKSSPLSTYNSSFYNKSLTLGPKSIYLTISSKGLSKVLKKEK